MQESKKGGHHEFVSQSFLITFTINYDLWMSSILTGYVALYADDSNDDDTIDPRGKLFLFSDYLFISYVTSH
jgi:hypothetical protein